MWMAQTHQLAFDVSQILLTSHHICMNKHSKFSTPLSCNFITFSNQNRHNRKGIPSYYYSWNLKIQWKKKTNLLDCNSCSALTKDKISLILNLHDDCHLGKKQTILHFILNKAFSENCQNLGWIFFCMLQTCPLFLIMLYTYSPITKGKVQGPHHVPKTHFTISLDY